jgi:hypothetical protein
MDVFAHDGNVSDMEDDQWYGLYQVGRILFAI